MENSVIEVGRLIYAKGHLIGARSAALAIAGVDATGVLAAVRNIGPEELIVDSAEMGFLTTVAATAAFTGLGFAIHKVVGFTVLPATGGRTVTPSPPRPIRKRFGDCFELLPAVDPAALQNQGTTFAEVQIAQTAVLTGGIFTAPEFNDPIGQLLLTCGQNGVYAGQIKHEPKNLLPWTLRPNEGLIFVNQAAFPTSLVGRFSIGVDVRIA